MESSHSTALMPPPYSSREDSLANIPFYLSTLSLEDVLSLLQRMNLNDDTEKFAQEHVDFKIADGHIGSTLLSSAYYSFIFPLLSG